MNKKYVFNPFYHYKRVMNRHYVEHQYTRQIILIPEDVALLFQDPVLQLMGLEESILDLPEYENVLQIFLEDQVLLPPDELFSELTGFLVKPQHTYLGLPYASAAELNDHLVVWGVPYGLGNASPNDLHRNSPALRRYGHKYNLRKSEFRKAGEILQRPIDFVHNPQVVDIGDSYFHPRTNPVDSLHQLTQRAKELVANQNRFIAIGGDHSITYPLFSGVSERSEDLICVHIDAHNDLFLTNECAFNDLALSHSSVIARLLMDGHEVHSLGLRDFVNSESLDLESLPHYHPHFCHSDNQFLEQVDELAETLQGRQVYLTLDVDVFDPDYFSSVTDPLPDGLRPDTVLRAFNRLAEATNILALDLVEANVEAQSSLDMHRFLKFLTDIVNQFHLSYYESPRTISGSSAAGHF